ncbi:MAG: tetratricopeptide repeat protein [Opitutaceae bacterium]|jgi:tetratricopeptide (TPR) repeat protein
MNLAERQVNPERSPKWRTIACAAALAAAVLAAYWPVYRAGFIWDDDAHVTRPDLRSLSGLWRIWTEIGATQQYYPVLHSAFWIEHRLWGDSAFGYHLLNVLLHATAACLFAAVLVRLWKNPQGSPGADGPASQSAVFRRSAPRGIQWLAALLFALHPVCVESVAWISEQKNTLSAVFYLLSAWAFLGWKDGGAGRRRLYALATAAYVLALLTKSVTATLPAALLVVLWWRDGGLSWKRHVLPLVPWLAAGGSAGLFTAWIERGTIGAQGAQFDFSWAQRCLIAGRAACFYAGKLVWPFHLSFVYPRWPVEGGSALLWLYPAAVASSILILAFAVRARGPMAAALYFLGTLFPALGFINVYPFVFSFVADHFQYLASLGVFALGASGWSLWHRRARTPLIPAAAAAALVLVLGFLTWRQCRVYRDQETLYSATLAENPDCWLAHDNLGVVLEHTGRPAEAVLHYREALRLKPDYPEAYNNLGNALARMGRWTEAEAQYAQAIRVRPGFAVAELDWGNALSDSGRYPEARAHYENAIRLHPDYPEAEYRLANALANSGRIDDAMAHYARAIRLRPDYPEAEANLGLALATAGRPQDALAHIREAVRLRPGYAEAHTYLGIALSRLGRYDDAVREYTEALRLNPGSAETHYQLGLALRALGRISDATDQFEAAEHPAQR